MSLPSDDLSDFDDSDFDIISSSGSTRSRNAEAHHDADEHYSEDETDHSIEPSSLLLDREWYGLVDPTREAHRPSLPSSMISEDTVVADEITHDATNINSPAVLSVEDVDVIDALSQSLERSSESINTSSNTPLGASYANLHFVTSPTGTARRASSARLSRSKLLESTPSPSSSVLQLAFPDPLPPPSIEEPVVQEEVKVVEAPIAETSDAPITITESPKVAPPAVPEELSESVLTTVAEKLEAPESILISEESATDSCDEEAAQEDAEAKAAASMAAAFTTSKQRFDALDLCVSKLSKHVLTTIAGNRWATSVYVYIYVGPTPQ